MKKPIRPKHYIVTDYWLAYYATDHCTLCGNSGVIDTTNARTGTGLHVGRKNWCICPNGQAMRAAGHSLDNAPAMARPEQSPETTTP